MNINKPYANRHAESDLRAEFFGCKAFPCNYRAFLMARDRLMDNNDRFATSLGRNAREMVDFMAFVRLCVEIVACFLASGGWFRAIFFRL